jgi:hypothetical protein
MNIKKAITKVGKYILNGLIIILLILVSPIIILSLILVVMYEKINKINILSMRKHLTNQNENATMNT